MVVHINWLDFLVIGVFFAMVISIAVYYARRAGKDTGQFFLSGRNMPWYIAGTAMVATTFAADTPLAVTELVAEKGIAGNWLWWNMAIGGMLTVFFFARLWRRAEVMTDVEFIEFRYSGKPAAILRGFRAVYLGLLMNAIVMGWVHEAMGKIFGVLLPYWDSYLLVLGVASVIALYASVSGLLGTARIDSLQFLFAMVGCVILAVIVVNLPDVGGVEGLTQKLPREVFAVFPAITENPLKSAGEGMFAISVGAFLAYVGVQWWSSWYPGADPGGGGYIAQRMMSAKNEKHSVFATLWFNIAHYTLRPWPWIMVALAALVILPRAGSRDELKLENPVFYQQAKEIFKAKDSRLKMAALDDNKAFAAYYEKFENTVDPGVMYPKLMARHLPAGLLGLLIAVFIAAYMSTIASQLNWGTSYLVNDFYRRFISSGKTERHYVWVSRMAIVLMTFISLFVARYFLNTVSGAWEFIINASAGMGAVLILRWYWWRINAWSEIAAMVFPLIIYPVVRYQFNIEPPLSLYPTVFGTTIAWLIVTFLTRPDKQETLDAFYKKLHPGGWGWKKWARRFPDVQPDRYYHRAFLAWIAGVGIIYAVLLGIGKLIFAEYLPATLFLSAAILLILVVRRNARDIT